MLENNFREMLNVYVEIFRDLMKIYQYKAQTAIAKSINETTWVRQLSNILYMDL